MMSSSSNKCESENTSSSKYSIDHEKKVLSDQAVVGSGKPPLSLPSEAGTGRPITPTAQANLVPVCYSDNEYMIAGAFDLLKAYAENEKLAVKLVCGHHTEKELVCMLPHIDVYVPTTIEELDSMWPEFTTSPRPAYLSLRRIV